VRDWKEYVTNFGRRPLIIAIGIQREYATPGMPFFLSGIGESLENCRRIIRHARILGWPVAHVRDIQDGHLFNGDVTYSEFVEGFEPLPFEMVFTKSNFSGYSCSGFCNMMEKSRNSTAYIIGYISTICCLSTIVEGYHHGHLLSFVSDASLAKATARATEIEVHEFAVDVISNYADVVTTKELLSEAPLEFGHFARANQ
jgi:nicotinamidase-related amidase